MRINNNIMSLNAQRMLGKNTTGQSKTLEKLSSGLQINRAADDAAGLSISEKMRGNIRALERSSKNAQDGISFLQAAEGALDEVSTMLERASELAEQLNDGINQSDDKKAINDELKELGKQITCIIDDTKFNGINIKTATSFGINGTNARLSVGTTMNSASAACTADNQVNEVTTKIKTVNEWRSTLGAHQNRLEYAKSNVDTTVENLHAAESRIRDTDMAAMMSNFNKYNILTQAATSMLAQANSTPQSVLSLLQ